MQTFDKELTEMAGVDQKEFQKVVKRVQALEERREKGMTQGQFEALNNRLAAVENRPNEIPWVYRHPLFTTVGIPLIAILATTFLGIIPHVDNDIRLQVKTQLDDGLQPQSDKLGKMAEDIATIKGTLNAWSPLITPQIFKKTASAPDPEFERLLPGISAAAHFAAESKTPIPSSDLSALFKRTVSLAAGKSTSSQAAWNATAALLQYQSSANESHSPAKTHTFGPASALGPNSLTAFFTLLLKGPVTWSWSNELVPEDQTFIAEPIGASHKEITEGHPYLRVLGTQGKGSIRLDGYHLRNVILEDINVEYDGGQVILENVYFVNCTFNFKPDQNGRGLATAVLASNTGSTTFKSVTS